MPHQGPTPKLPNLSRVLELKRWTQTELARRSEIGLAYVNQLVTGRRHSPTLQVLEKLADALDIPTAMLIDRRASDEELRKELSQGALRKALAAGISHPKFPRFVGTELAPIDVDGWRQLAMVLEVADRPRTRRAGARAPSDSSQQIEPRSSTTRR